jgi:hypothetical protein
VDAADVMNNCDAKAQRAGLARLNPIERIVVLVSRADFEIELGGLDSFYYNSAGDEAVPTVEALESVGAKLAGAALRAANGLFPGGAPPRNREQRFEGLEVVRSQAESSLAALGREYGREEPSVFSRLCEFIEEHATELKEHVTAT